jgi:hypothetical protein
MKLYMEPRERRRLGAPASALANRLGIELADTPDGAALLALTDITAQTFADKYPKQFMPMEAFERIKNNLRMAELGIPVVPSSTDPSAFSGPVFVKPLRTLKNSVSKLAYTTWDSAQDFMEKHGIEFQSNGEQLVFQPAWSYTSRNFELNFAVNQDGEALFYSSLNAVNGGVDRYSSFKTAPANKVLEAAISRVCREQQIKGGMHCVDFTEVDGEYKLFDWNPRPTFSAVLELLKAPGYADAGMAHLCGLPLADAPNVHFEQRTYFNPPIDGKWYPRLCELGFFARSDNTGITRITAVTESEASAEILFNQMESECVG